MLGSLAARYEDAERSRTELRMRVERLDAELARLLELERSVRDSLVAAHAEAEALDEDARQRSEALVETRELRVQEAATQLEREHAWLEEELGRLDELEETTRSTVGSLVTGALHGLEQPDPASDQKAAGELLLADPAELELGAEAASPAAIEDDDPTDTSLLESYLTAPFQPVWPGPEGDDGLELPLAAPEETRHRVGGPWPSPLILVASLLAAGALIVAAFVHFGGGGGEKQRTEAPAPAAPVVVATPAASPAPAVAAEPASQPTGSAPTETVAAPTKAKLVLAATGGDSWVQVRAGSAEGKVLYEGFIPKGSSQQFVGRRLWIRMGSPSTLSARLDGKPLSNLPAGVANVLVTPRGLRTLGLG